MGFPTALSAYETDYISTMQLETDCYFLFWGQNIIFKAQVNQISFDSSFATITYDSVSGSGVYTDVLEGFTVWVSPTDDIRDAVRNGWWGRLRSAATSTVLNVEWNSYIPSDDDYLFVTKDIRESTKTPFWDGTNWLVDFSIAYQAPRPIIYGVPSWLFAVINSDGTADITIEPNAYAIADGATISSWALTTTDSGTQVSFNAGTGKAVIRYSTPGDYMPRLTVTDSNGTTQWISPSVKIAPADLSSVINLSFEDFVITGDTDGGWNMSMGVWDGALNILDGTKCAVYMPHKSTGNRLLFCGRSHREESDFTADGFGEANFNVIGLASIMNQLNAISWYYKDTASPADFDEMKTATLWRVVAAHIAEMTNINNSHSLELDNTSDDYHYISYFFQKGTLLESMKGQMWSINYDFDWSSDGMFKLVRNMRYQTETERTSLTNIANFEFKHYSQSERDEILYSLEHAHSLQVGKATAGCAWYNTTSKKLTFFGAISPPVQPARGPEQSVTDRQILKADQTTTDAETEGENRAKNDFAAKQQIDTLNSIRLPGAFIGKIGPSVSDWYSHLITVYDGIRGITYTALERWLCTGLTISYDKKVGAPVIDPVWQIESNDLGFAVTIDNPLPLTFYDVPVMMPQAAFPTFNSDPSFDFPTGATDGDEQPIGQEDTNPLVGAQDPATMPVFNNSTLVVWSETQAQMTREMGSPSATWFAIEPSSLGGDVIKMFAWNRNEDGGTGGYLIANNETIATPETKSFYRKNVGSMEEWTVATLTDMLATMVNVTSKTGVILYGKFQEFQSGSWTIDRLRDGAGGNDDLFPYTATAGYPPLSYAPGIYNAGSDLYNAQNASGVGGVADDVVFDIPPGATVTQARVELEGDRNIPSSGATVGDRDCGVYYDDGSTIVRIGSGHAFGSGTYGPPSPQSIIMTKTLASLSEGRIIAHASMDKSIAHGDARIVRFRVIGSSLADYVGTRYSSDNGETYEGPKSVGLMDLGEGSFTRRKGQRVLGAKNDTVKRAPLAGQPFLFTADQGAVVGAGQYAMALLKFGKDDDYLMAPDGGAVGLWKVVNNVATDITPNDGANDGFADGPGVLAMTSIDDDYIWFLANFGGSIKLAYSTDLGTSWNFNGDPTSNATWITANPRSTKQIYISDGATILQSLDGGVTLTSHVSPIADLEGVAAL